MMAVLVLATTLNIQTYFLVDLLKANLLAQSYIKKQMLHIHVR